MKKYKFKYQELLDDKPYLSDENYCPNVGKFPNGPSDFVNEILDGANVYRYDIYRFRDDDDKIINLGGGDPIECKTYKYFKKDINNFIKKNQLNDYPNTIGNERLKKQVIEYLNSIDINNVEEEEIIFTNSTTHAYYLLLNTIVKPGDVVIIPVPTYGLFAYGPEKMRGRIVFYELKEENNWKIIPEELNQLIEKTNKDLYNKYKGEKYIPRVVALYNQNPNNPLSIYMGRNDNRLIYDINKVCFDNKVLVIDDLVYKDSIYNRNDYAVPMSSFHEFRDNIVSLFGISKSYSLSGARAGFILGNKYIIEDIRDNIFVSQDSISILSQIAIASVFNNCKKRVKYRNKFLNNLDKKYLYNLDIIKYFVMGRDFISKKHRKSIEKRLSKDNIEKYGCGMKNVSFYHDMIPVSGFFAILNFTDIKGKKINGEPINNDKDLIIQLYKNHKIKFLPGSSFGWQNKDEIIGRITFSKSPKDLIEGMTLLSKVMNDIK